MEYEKSPHFRKQHFAKEGWWCFLPDSFSLSCIYHYQFKPTWLPSYKLLHSFHTQTQRNFQGCNCLAWDLGLWCFINTPKPYYYHSWARCWWQRCLGKLPSKRGLIKNTKSGLQQHSPKQHCYSVCACGEEAGVFCYLSKRNRLNEGSHKRQSCCMGGGWLCGRHRGRMRKERMRICPFGGSKLLLWSSCPWTAASGA